MEKDINRLKVVLAEKKRTNKWLAAQLGCAPTTVSKWVTNACQPPMETVQRQRKQMNKRIEYIIDEILDQYMYADTTDRPWIIGFSGGKDSTVLLTLVWLALRKIKEEKIVPFQLRRPIYVVCNDTMVENPIISSYVDDVLSQIEKKAREEDLPIFVRKTIPKLEDSFWVNVIGKGSKHSFPLVY